MGSGRGQLSSSSVSPALSARASPLCWEEGLLAGLFTPESTPSRLPSRGFSSAVSKCVPPFSLPPFCSQPSTQPLMLWACVKVPWKTRGSPLNTSASFPLLRVGPEQAAFLRWCLCFFLLNCWLENHCFLLACLGHCHQAWGSEPPVPGGQLGAVSHIPWMRQLGHILFHQQVMGKEDVSGA